MKGIFAWLSTINKAWLGGVVAFVATFVVQQFFGVTLETGTTDLITNVLWQVLVALGVAAPAAVAVYAVPNKPTVEGVERDATKLGLIYVASGVLIRPEGLPHQAGPHLVLAAIYAVLINNMIIAANIHSALFSVAAYTVILCFSLFKTGSLAKSLFNAH